jgi:hypothetical protein
MPLQLDITKGTNAMTLNAVIETAKAKAANSPKWIRAIERAGAALQSGELCVTLLSGYALVTSPRGSYRVNGHCECEASRRGHSECYHRAGVRLTEMMESEPEAQPAPVRVPSRVIRSTEFNRCGRLTVYRVDGWSI